MFFTYSQNNSGGGFDTDEKKGIGTYVIVEADNSNEADTIAESIGIYFDGVLTGSDCECCGDRWYSAYEGHDAPEVYGENVEKGVVNGFWTDGYIHYKNGSIKQFGWKRKKKMKQPDLRPIYITEGNVIGKTIMLGNRELTMTSMRPEGTNYFTLDNERCLYDPKGKRLGYLKSCCPLTAKIEIKKENLVFYDKEENLYWMLDK